MVVYFGSWCAFCGRYVPRILRLAEDLTKSKLSFDFYGLPRAVQSDERARRNGVNDVPTAVVSQNGTEIGRIRGDAWLAPEEAILRLLSGKH